MYIYVPIYGFHNTQVHADTGIVKLSMEEFYQGNYMRGKKREHTSTHMYTP